MATPFCILPSPKQSMQLPISPHPHQHFIFPVLKVSSLWVWNCDPLMFDLHFPGDMTVGIFHLHIVLDNYLLTSFVNFWLCRLDCVAYNVLFSFHEYLIFCFFFSYWSPLSSYCVPRKYLSWLLGLQWVDLRPEEKYSRCPLEQHVSWHGDWVEYPVYEQ